MFLTFMADDEVTEQLESPLVGQTKLPSWKVFCDSAEKVQAS